MLLALAWLIAATPDGGAPRGELSREEIIAVIKQAQPHTRECFDVASSQPEARAPQSWVVLASWRIEPDGSVSHVTIDAAPIPSLGGCIATIIRHLQFPPPRGNGAVEVRHPWRPKSF